MPPFNKATVTFRPESATGAGCPPRPPSPRRGAMPPRVAGAAMDGAAPAAPFETAAGAGTGKTCVVDGVDDKFPPVGAGTVADGAGGCELTAPLVCRVVPPPLAWITIVPATTAGENVKANAAPHEKAAVTAITETAFFSIGGLYHFSRISSRNSPATRAATPALRTFPRWR